MSDNNVKSGKRSNEVKGGGDVTGNNALLSQYSHYEFCDVDWYRYMCVCVCVCVE